MSAGHADVPTWWWLAARARGTGLVLRLLVVAGALITMGAARLAGDGGSALAAAAVGAALVWAAAPDTHAGIVVLVLVGVDWWVSVDDVTTPWSIAAAGGIAIAHVSAAASTVAAPSTPWTAEMIARWTRRTVGVVVPAAVLWAVVEIAVSVSS